MEFLSNTLSSVLSSQKGTIFHVVSGAAGVAYCSVRGSELNGIAGRKTQTWKEIQFSILILPMQN